MNLAAFAIAWCLFAQVPAEGDRYAQPELRRRKEAARIDEPAAEERPAEPATDGGFGPAGDARERTPAEHDPAAHLAPVNAAGHGKLRPPELLAQALEKPVEGALVGTPTTLLTALSRSNDRQQQLRITLAYWKLCTAQADYHWALDQRDRLAQCTRAHTNSAGALSARAAARADVRDAQLAVAQAQEDLVELMGAQGEPTPPLASDRPHVGDYYTLYETIFANRQPPPRIRLIHRTLPVLRQAIDAHGEAIVAAIDALDASAEHFQKSGQGLATILATMEELKRERRLFMSDVRDYNQGFAEYAFVTAQPNADSRALVEMLILTPRGVEPAGAKGSRLRGPAPPGGPPAEGQRPSEAEPPAAEPRERTTQYQHDAATEEPGLYQGLVAITDAPQRVQRLSNLLHWDRNMPPDAGEPTTLGDCLRGVAPENRLAVISAYWRAREQAARYQSLTEQAELLNVLPAIANELHRDPGMAEAAVRLQAARKAARAQVFDAHVALLLAEFNLMQAAGRRMDDPWMLPSTAPQSGRYLVNAGGPRSHHWSEMVRLEHGKLEERADSILQADVHRAALVNETRRGAEANATADEIADEPMRLDGALRSIRRQSVATLAFLHDLTEYNIAIAHFALAVLPPTIAADELVKKLVVARTTRREA